MVTEAEDGRTVPGMSARILVTGAGVTGGEVLRRLAASDLAARALVRDLEHAEPFRKIGVELTEGDFAQLDSWKRALDGVTKVFSITPAHRDAEKWNAIFLEAAKDAGVELVVRLSGTSVSPSSAAEFHRQMGLCDEVLTASGLDYTILQPNVFYQNMMIMARPIREQGVFRSAVGGARISMIDVRDIADVAIKVLTEDDHIGKTYVLTGPQSLTYFDVARLLSEAVGKTIRYEALNEDDAIKSLINLGVPEPVARSRVEVHRSFSNGAFTPVTNDVQMLLGQSPRPFTDFARDYAAMFR
jgi:uncharacterized protein YbjT (DUF2867 family)